MKGSDATRADALLFANGELGAAARRLAQGYAEAGARIVSVDGGLRHCRALGLEPEILIGDLDSVHAAEGLPTLAFPREKNASDLELALEWLGEQSIERVCVFGLTGGRTDHMLFNWLLPVVRAWPFRLRLVDDTVQASVVRADAPFHEQLQAGQTVSLLPLGEGCRGVSTAGLAYPLHEHHLPAGTTRGLSNRVDSTPEDSAPVHSTRDAPVAVTVSVGHGTLLVLVVHEPEPSNP